ncbi:histidine kinase [Nocardiopsis sp. CT-R113]|uniref:histidine kinase n=1 Tax=Nocardiopsis codii TaxID=3065942 RepID=A0ABU7K6Z4_9ACTN|nr:histidine kinase [Nocardiopsis sp. CT-R113]MEE2037302.1 histidine kinase [Nocardiopsis sp. CT-R113]
MRTWVNDRGRSVGARWRNNWQWWWDRRLRIADWLYALGTLPLSLLLQVGVNGVFSGALDAGSAALSRSGSVSAMIALLGFAVLFSVVPAFVAAAAILFRRTRPKWLLLIAVVLLAGFGNFVPASIAIYSYAVYSNDRRLVAAWFGLLCLAAGGGYGTNGLTYVIAVVFFLVVPVTAGLWIGTRRQLIDRLHERAERLEREQHLMAEQALTTERTRIAREMHDVVAHRVSLMVLHAGGLEVSSEDSRTVEAAGLIRTTGREALSELRGILGVLRDETTAAAPTAPQPVLADLDRLVGEWNTAGMVIRREETGQARPLASGVERTAYRIIQEGLTNAAKHAPGAEVTVRLHHGLHQVEVEVANEPVPAPSVPMPQSGFGLTGLHERVVLAGGSLSAGVCPDGGWRLRAILRTDGRPSEDEGRPVGEDARQAEDGA